jgi:hypothetical protein
MKKILIFAVALSLLLPAAAFAATEFSLGGFVKLDAFWDSTQQGKNLNTVVNRNNDTAFHHGNFRATAQGSRFNFTIKGPKLFGAQVTGFIEMDFDGVNGPSASASQVYTPRLRHAMFRFNWPETELLLGQYWSMFCSFYAESAEDGPLQATGTPTARLPQIRLTQKFLGDWAVAGLVGNPNAYGPVPTTAYSGNSNNGGAAETPQIQAMVKYNHDWWGKAAYYGHPIPFTAQVTAGWQRNIVHYVDANNNVTNATGGNIAGGALTRILPNQYVAPWMVMGTLFIPVIPTHSANLAGTASILAQYWIGQGVDAFGFTGDSTSVIRLDDANDTWNISPLKRWGGFVQGQYYFTNQWFVNALYAISRVYGLDNVNDYLTAPNAAGAAVNNVNGQYSTDQQVNATLWYRPISAIKFGLQYSFVQTTWLTYTTVNSNRTRTGDEHRVEFAGYFFF